MAKILVAGGAHDPNIHAVLEAAERRGLETIPLLIGPDDHPALSWDLQSASLQINGRECDATAAFIRRDVFDAEGSDAEYRSRAWFTALQGWLAVSPQIRVLNRNYISRYANKLEVLCRARIAGMQVPATLVTNDLERLQAHYQGIETIAKPVPGGGYAELVDELLSDTEFRDGTAASPAIVQPRLPGVDLRIYALDRSYVGFCIHSGTIDYRKTRDRTIERAGQLPGSVVRRLENLMDSLSLDWGAADFKLPSENDEPVFLEINTQPMFSAFDRFAQGSIADAIVMYLSRE
jgi:hypothetical protein